jgi:hypothetical protein
MISQINRSRKSLFFPIARTGGCADPPASLAQGTVESFLVLRCKSQKLEAKAKYRFGISKVLLDFQAQPERSKL